MLWRKLGSGGGRAGHGCDGGTSLAAECGTNNCVSEWELIQLSFPYNVVMDLSQRCKTNMIEEEARREEGEEEDQLGFGALIEYNTIQYYTIQ